jgi:hypothetical protein
LGRAARDHHATLTSVLSSAMLWQVDEVLYGGSRTSLRAAVWVDLRPRLRPQLEARQLTSCLSVLRPVITVERGRGMWALVAETGRKVRQASKSDDRFSAARVSGLMMRANTRRPFARVSNVALSYVTGKSVGTSYGDMAVREMSGFVSNNHLGSEVAAVAGIFDGKLWCNLLLLDSDIDVTTADTLAEGVRTTILQTATGELR